MELFLYILRSKSSGRFYVGVSSDPEKRLRFHNYIERGFTARYRPWEIVFMQEYETKEDALCAERKVKSWKSRKMILKIIDGELKL